jgi:telomere length regulation protein
MDGLLTPLSQTYRETSKRDKFLSHSVPTNSIAEDRPGFQGSSPEEALRTLKGEPSYDDLRSVLTYLRKGIQGKHDFDIRNPSPQGAQIVHVLVTEIVPNYWTVLNEATAEQKSGSVGLLVSCLQTITGINALLAHLRALLREAQADPKELKQSQTIYNLDSTVSLLSHLLRPESTLQRLWDIVTSLSNPTQARVMKQEFISLFSNGRITSLSAESEHLLQKAEKLESRIWLADGKEYIDWLGRGLVNWICSGTGDGSPFKACAELMSRALRLPHPGAPPYLLKHDLQLTIRHRSTPLSALQ